MFAATGRDQTVGTVLRFRCRACAYQKDLCLGSGMLGVSGEAIICDTCRELAVITPYLKRQVSPLALKNWKRYYDFEPVEEDYVDAERRWVWLPLGRRCPSAGGATHSIRSWREPWPCPRCGVPMGEGEDVGL